MHQIRFYLPLRDNAGTAFPARMFHRVEQELSRRFGGVTAHLQSPAHGLWQHAGTTHADDVLIFEVLDSEFDRRWWRSYRESLEHCFRQKRILLLVQSVDVL